MKNICLFLITLLYAAQNYSASMSSCQIIEDGLTEGAVYALHNPQGQAKLEVTPGSFDDGSKTISWEYQSAQSLNSCKDVALIGNMIFLQGKQTLRPVSLYAAGGVAKNPYKGPENVARTFDYFPASRFFVLQDPEEFDLPTIPSIDSLETVYPQTASYSNEEHVQVEEEAHERIPEEFQFLPEMIQRMESLADVLEYYKYTKKAALIIDLHAALAYCNPNWQEEYPIRQIPMILSLLRGNLTCRPYEDMTRAQIVVHEAEEAARKNSSCTLL